MNFDLQAKPWIDVNKTEILKNLGQGILPHAMLLYGSHLSGQDELGEWLANTLLCDQLQAEHGFCGFCKSCKLVKAGSHPDLQVIDNGDKHIGVDLIREASSFLQKTAQIAKSKVVLVASVELLTEAAANALLKTLEEPTDNSYLVLACNDIDLLLPTILSRCSQVKLQAPTGDRLAQLVNEPGLVTPFSNINHFAELTDPELKQAYIEFGQYLHNYLTNQSQETELLEALTHQSHALRWLSDGVSQLLRMKSGWAEQLTEHRLYGLHEKFSLEQLNAVLKLIIHANKQLKTLTQANKTFTIEALLVDIEQVLQD